MQRLLASHATISTTSEPWILLPFLYTLRNSGLYAEYGHNMLAIALQDFCKRLPNGREEYLSEMRTFLIRLYTKAAQDKAVFFLDKTPRYHFIVNDVIRMFPDGKFIFLWRNPLAVIASIIETWAGGKWKLYTYKADLFDGLKNLVEAYEKYKGQACSLRYEDLLSNPENELQRMFTYLELPFDRELITQFNKIQFKERLGDSSGTKQYQVISKEPLKKWKHILTNPIRKVWCRRYLKWIGKERLAVMGYDLDQLMSELNEIPSNMKYAGSDLVRMFGGLIYSWGEPVILRDKCRMIPKWWRIHAHR